MKEVNHEAYLSNFDNVSEEDKARLIAIHQNFFACYVDMASQYVNLIAQKSEVSGEEIINALKIFHAEEDKPLAKIPADMKVMAVNRAYLYLQELYQIANEMDFDKDEYLTAIEEYYFSE